MKNLTPSLFDFSDDEDNHQEYYYNSSSTPSSLDLPPVVKVLPLLVVNHLPKEIMLEILSFIRLENLDPVASQSELIKLCFGRFDDNTIECLGWIDLDSMNWRRLRNYPQQVLQLLKFNRESDGIELKESIFQMMRENDMFKGFFFDDRKFECSIIESIRLNSSNLELNLIQLALQTFTHVKAVDISLGCWDASMIEVVPFFSKLSNLKRLVFHYDYIISYDLVELSKVTPQLEELQVGSASSIFSCIEAFPNWKKMKRIVWSYVTMGNIFSDNFEEEPASFSSEDVKSFYEFLNRSSVEHLTLKLEKLTNFEITTPKLKDLAFIYCTISPLSYTNILKLDQLERLSFINPYNSEDNLKEFIEKVPYHLSNLKYLCLNDINTSTLECINKIGTLQTVEIIIPPQSKIIDHLSVLNNHPSLRTIIIRGESLKIENFRNLFNRSRVNLVLDTNTNFL